MREIKVKVPEDLALELESIDIDVSLVVNRIILDKLTRLAKLKKIIDKSELTEEKAGKLANKVNERLYKKYKELYEKKFWKR